MDSQPDDTEDQVIGGKSAQQENKTDPATPLLWRWDNQNHELVSKTDPLSPIAPPVTAIPPTRAMGMPDTNKHAWM